MNGIVFSIMMIHCIYLEAHYSRLLNGTPLLSTKTWPSPHIEINDKVYIVHRDTIIVFKSDDEAEEFARFHCAGMACEPRKLNNYSQPTWYLWSALHDTVATHNSSIKPDEPPFYFRHINIITNYM